jgi:hypothetical protein
MHLYSSSSVRPSPSTSYPHPSLSSFPLPPPHAVPTFLPTTLPSTARQVKSRRGMLTENYRKISNVFLNMVRVILACNWKLHEAKGIFISKQSVDIKTENLKEFWFRNDILGVLK